MVWCRLGPERLAVLERWLPYTVTIVDRFHFYHVKHHVWHPYTGSDSGLRSIVVVCS